MYRSVHIAELQQIRALLHSSTRTSEVMDLMAKKATEVLKAKGSLVRTFDIGKNELGESAAYGLREPYLSNRLLSRRETIMDLYELNKVVIIDDILHDPRVQHPREAWAEGIRMMLDVPLGLRGRIVGMIRVYFTELRLISREELSFLVSCATCGACAIEKARAMEVQKSEYDHLALETAKLSALGRMAAGIAHEINNPLAGILLYSTNLLKKAPKDGPMREGLEIIVHETQRCGKIIQELLEFSRQGEPDKVLVNINDVIGKALSILENEFLLHHIEMRRELSDELEDILVDANQMEQVFVNLLLNAVEAIEDRGVITIRSFMGPNRKSEIVEIEDTGIGIPQQNLERLFEPFFSSKVNGTGLGLAVSFGIVQKHEGTINVTSSAGHGTRVSIELPLLPVIAAANVKDWNNG